MDWLNANNSILRDMPQQLNLEILQQNSLEWASGLENNSEGSPSSPNSETSEASTFEPFDTEYRFPPPLDYYSEPPTDDALEPVFASTPQFTTQIAAPSDSSPSISISSPTEHPTSDKIMVNMENSSSQNDMELETIPEVLKPKIERPVPVHSENNNSAISTRLGAIVSSSSNVFNMSNNSTQLPVNYEKYSFLGNCDGNFRSAFRRVTSKSDYIAPELLQADTSRNLSTSSLSDHDGFETSNENSIRVVSNSGEQIDGTPFETPILGLITEPSLHAAKRRIVSTDEPLIVHLSKFKEFWTPEYKSIDKKIILRHLSNAVKECVPLYHSNFHFFETEIGNFCKETIGVDAVGCSIFKVAAYTIRHKFTNTVSRPSVLVKHVLSILIFILKAIDSCNTPVFEKLAESVENYAQIHSKAYMITELDTLLMIELMIKAFTQPTVPAAEKLSVKRTRGNRVSLCCNVNANSSELVQKRAKITPRKPGVLVASEKPETDNVTPHANYQVEDMVCDQGLNEQDIHTLTPERQITKKVMDEGSILESNGNLSGSRSYSMANNSRAPALVEATTNSSNNETNKIDASVQQSKKRTAISSNKTTESRSPAGSVSLKRKNDALPSQILRKQHSSENADSQAKAAAKQPNTGMNTNLSVIPESLSGKSPIPKSVDLGVERPAEGFSTGFSSNQISPTPFLASVVETDGYEEYQNSQSNANSLKVQNPTLKQLTEENRRLESVNQPVQQLAISQTHYIDRSVWNEYIVKLRSSGQLSEDGGSLDSIEQIMEQSTGSVRSKLSSTDISPTLTPKNGTEIPINKANTNEKTSLKTNLDAFPTLGSFSEDNPVLNSVDLSAKQLAESTSSGSFSSDLSPLLLPTPEAETETSQVNPDKRISSQTKVAIVLETKLSSSRKSPDEGRNLGSTETPKEKSDEAESVSHLTDRSHLLSPEPATETQTSQVKTYEKTSPKKDLGVLPTPGPLSEENPVLESDDLLTERLAELVSSTSPLRDISYTMLPQFETETKMDQTAKKREDTPGLVYAEDPGMELNDQSEQLPNYVDLVSPQRSPSQTLLLLPPALTTEMCKATTDNGSIHIESENHQAAVTLPEAISHNCSDNSTMTEGTLECLNCNSTLRKLCDIFEVDIGNSKELTQMLFNIVSTVEPNERIQVESVIAVVSKCKKLFIGNSMEKEKEGITISSFLGVLLNFLKTFKTSRTHLPLENLMSEIQIVRNHHNFKNVGIPHWDARFAFEFVINLLSLTRNSPPADFAGFRSQLKESHEPYLWNTMIKAKYILKVLSDQVRCMGENFAELRKRIDTKWAETDETDIVSSENVYNGIDTAFFIVRRSAVPMSECSERVSCFEMFASIQAIALSLQPCVPVHSPMLKNTLHDILYTEKEFRNKSVPNKQVHLAVEYMLHMCIS